MNHIFGDFCEEISPSQEYLILFFLPSSIPIKKRWVQNGLSADFLADYFSVFFLSPEESTSTINRQTEVKSAVSYIANELLENAMKFHDERQQSNISIALHLHPDKLIFLATNSIKPEKVSEFQSFLQELIANDPEELYVRQIEESVAEENNSQSKLGFLTMINDYLAKIGWKFETVQKNPEIITVTTMVQLEVKTLT